MFGALSAPRPGTHGAAEGAEGAKGSAGSPGAAGSPGGPAGGPRGGAVSSTGPAGRSRGGAVSASGGAVSSRGAVSFRGGAVSFSGGAVSSRGPADGPRRGAAAFGGPAGRSSGGAVSASGGAVSASGGAVSARGPVSGAAGLPGRTCGRAAREVGRIPGGRRSGRGAGRGRRRRGGRGLRRGGPGQAVRVRTGAGVGGRGRGRGTVRDALGRVVGGQHPGDLVLGTVVARLAFDPGVVGDVHDHQAVDRLGGGFDDDDLVGVVAVPLVALEQRAPLRPERCGQRVPAGAADPGHAVVVDEDGRPGLEDGLVAVGPAVAEGVVGDPGVRAQDHRGESAQELGDLLPLDAGDLGEGPGLGVVRGQEGDLAFDVAAAEPVRPAVQAGGGGADRTDATAARVGQRRLDGRRLGGGRRRGEGVGAGGADGLEGELHPVGGGALGLFGGRTRAAGGEEADDRQEGRAGRYVTARRLTGCRCGHVIHVVHAALPFRPGCSSLVCRISPTTATGAPVRSY
ncbi:hypothetical protein SLAVM298S_03789 [Streptomyces lavendulae subsp. lavendulae]